MDELELFGIWFEDQEDFEFIVNGEGVWGKVSFSQVLKLFKKERNDVITKYIIAKSINELTDSSEDEALKVADKIVKSLQQHRKEVEK